MDLRIYPALNRFWHAPLQSCHNISSSSFCHVGRTYVETAWLDGLLHGSGFSKLLKREVKHICHDLSTVDVVMEVASCCLVTGTHTWILLEYLCKHIHHGGAYLYYALPWNLYPAHVATGSYIESLSLFVETNVASFLKMSVKTSVLRICPSVSTWKTKHRPDCVISPRNVWPEYPSVFVCLISRERLSVFLALVSRTSGSVCSG